MSAIGEGREAEGDVAVSLRGVSVSFGAERVLDRLDLDIGAGETVALVGPSGAGKSTLLHVMAGLVPPDSGTVSIAGISPDLFRSSERERSVYRRTTVGYVFQLPTFLADLRMVENVAVPLLFGGVPRRPALEKARAMLDRLGVGHTSSAFPDTPSGGELQRAGVARSIIAEPRIVLCDEPTGALDEVNAAAVRSILLGLADMTGATVVIATHDRAFAAECGRTVVVRRPGVLVP